MNDSTNHRCDNCLKDPNTCDSFFLCFDDDDAWDDYVAELDQLADHAAELAHEAELRSGEDSPEDDDMSPLF